ncbi:MAG: sigma-70 family RNA polymerase sigma factor [Verrucomicrobia bacterium]|nr:sigma-70 family RNA polymerase sigma factor [Verrucomicrobiota bacterium]
MIAATTKQALPETGAFQPGGVASCRADGYERLIRYVRESGASVETLDAVREQRLRQTVAHYRRFLADLMSWPQFRQSILIEMQLRDLRGGRQGVSAQQAIQSLLVEHQKDVLLGVLESFTGNITARQARHILFQFGAEDDIPAARRRWLLPGELVSLFDKLKLHIKRDYPRYKAAQTDLFFAQVRLVYDLAARMTSGPDQFHDAFQEGCMALLHAIDKTANTTGCRLSTCAQEWIRGAMLRFLQGQRTPVHVPVNALPRLRQLEIMPQRVSLETAWADGGEAHDEQLTHPAEALAQNEIRPLLDRLFECLTDKQRQVIVLRYGLNADGVAHSLEETARLIGISFQEVDRREKRAIERVQSCGSRELLRELALCLA